MSKSAWKVFVAIKMKITAARHSSTKIETEKENPRIISFPLASIPCKNFISNFSGANARHRVNFICCCCCRCLFLLIRHRQHHRLSLSYRPTSSSQFIHIYVAHSLFVFSMVVCWRSVAERSVQREIVVCWLCSLLQRVYLFSYLWFLVFSQLRIVDELTSLGTPLRIVYILHSNTISVHQQLHKHSAEFKKKAVEQRKTKVRTLFIRIALAKKT